MQRRLSYVVGATIVASALSNAGCNGSESSAETGGASSHLVTGGSSSSSTGGVGGSTSSTGGVGGSTSSTGGAGGSTSSTGDEIFHLDGASPLSSLTPTEASLLCGDAYAHFERTIGGPAVCKSQALAFALTSGAMADAQLQENCKGRETTCLEAAPAQPNCDAIPAPCTATVSQYELCVADQATTFRQGIDAQPSCAAVAVTDLPTVWAFVSREPPASCATLTEACPGLNYASPR